MIQVIQSGKPHKLHLNPTAPPQPQPGEVEEAEASQSSEQPPFRMPPPNDDFAQLLQLSRQRLRNDELKKISKVMAFSESKVYQLQTAPPKRYLAHILSVSEAKTQQKVLGLAKEREDEIEAAIYSSDLNIRRRPKMENIRKKQEKLAMKLSLIGREMRSMSVVQADGSQVDLSQIVDSKYWDPSSERTSKAKEFVERLRSQKRKARARLRQLQSKSVQEMQVKEKLEKDQQERLLKQRINESVKKLLQYKKQREQEKQERHERRRQQSEFLQKYQVKTPLFREREEEFQKEYLKRQDEERKRKLSEIKQKYRPLDKEEMEQHAKNYQDFKHKMQEEIQKRLKEENLLNERTKEMQDLYHGHFHQKLAEEDHKVNDKKEKSKLVHDKIAQYNDNVLSQVRPKVDQKKRKELEILKLELEYKGKRVKKRIEDNGDVVFEDVSSKVDHKKLGIQYLSELRKMHSQLVPRKIDSSAPASLSSTGNSPKSLALIESEKKDYLHEGAKGLKATLSTWKKDINSESLSRDQKYDLVLKKVQVIDEQARQKEVKLRMLKDPPQIMNVKESLDKYYLNSINAKLSVLNQVIYDK